jgi:hypothetical protein
VVRQLLLLAPTAAAATAAATALPARAATLAAGLAAAALASRTTGRPLSLTWRLPRGPLTRWPLAGLLHRSLAELPRGLLPGLLTLRLRRPLRARRLTWLRPDRINPQPFGIFVGIVSY